MIETAPDLSMFPPLPEFEAEWAALYMEPIVQSGERLTIGIVARAGHQVAGCLTINDRALQCLYGDSADGMRTMMNLALARAIAHVERDFAGEFVAGMHGVTLGKRRYGAGDDIQHILNQATSLCSSLSALHGEEERGSSTGWERNALWRKVQRAMDTVDPQLCRFFDKEVGIVVRDTQVSVKCDYFSSQLAINMCGLTPGPTVGQLYERASARISRLDQLNKHEALIEDHQRPEMILLTPTDQVLAGRYSKAHRRNYSDRLLLLQDQADAHDLPLIIVHSPEEGANAIRMEERAA